MGALGVHGLLCPAAASLWHAPHQAYCLLHVITGPALQAHIQHLFTVCCTLQQRASGGARQQQRNL